MQALRREKERTALLAEQLDQVTPKEAQHNQVEIEHSVDQIETSHRLASLKFASPITPQEPCLVDTSVCVAKNEFPRTKATDIIAEVRKISPRVEAIAHA